MFVLRISSSQANQHADVAELADALDSGSSGGNPVEVQVLSSALVKTRADGNFAVSPFSLPPSKIAAGQEKSRGKSCVQRVTELRLAISRVDHQLFEPGHGARFASKDKGIQLGNYDFCSRINNRAINNMPPDCRPNRIGG